MFTPAKFAGHFGLPTIKTFLHLQGRDYSNIIQTNSMKYIPFNNHLLTLFGICAPFFFLWNNGVFAADLHVTGALDVDSDVSFGTTDALTRGVLMDFTKGTATLKSQLAQPNGTFNWKDNGDSTSAFKMKLGSTNTLELFNSSGTATISLSPSNGQVNLVGSGSGIYSNGSAVFTINGSGNLIFANRPFNISSTTASTSSTTGALTVSGGIGVASDSFINGLRIGKGAANKPDNTALGLSTLGNITSGDRNTASGSGALYTVTTGIGNSALGAGALYYNVGGSNNTAIGDSSGVYIGSVGTSQLTGPVSSIYIGAGARGYSATETNAIVIGVSAIGQGANTTVIGTSATVKTVLSGTVEASALQAPGTATLAIKGKVVLEQSQGDISMGIYN